MTADEVYEQAFRDEITAQRPESLCDVGCGAGNLVRHAKSLGIAAIGIEPDCARAADGIAAGLDLRPGSAEALPFDDASFDVVAFGNSLHHVTDIPAALAEAARIARRAIVILDPWFDLSIPSQEVCDRFERILKRADRNTGMAHWDPIGAGTILAAFDVIPTRGISIRHLLQLTPLTLDAFEAQARRALSQDSGIATEIAATRHEIGQFGITEPGALLMTIAK